MLTSRLAAAALLAAALAVPLTAPQAAQAQPAAEPPPVKAVKIVLVVAFAAAAPAVGILLSWTVAAAVCVVGTSVYLFARAIPAHHIKNVTAKHNGKLVLAAEWGAGVSQNPFLQFRFKGGAPGDKVSIQWTDNTGDSRADEVVLA